MEGTARGPRGPEATASGKQPAAVAAAALIKSPVTSSEPWGPAGLGSLGLTRTCHSGRRGACVPSHSGDPGGGAAAPQPAPAPLVLPSEPGGTVRVSPPGGWSAIGPCPRWEWSGERGICGDPEAPPGRTRRRGGKEQKGKGGMQREGSGTGALPSLGAPTPSSSPRTRRGRERWRRMRSRTPYPTPHSSLPGGG